MNNTKSTPAAILTVTLNPTLDVSTSVARLIDHAKLRCSPELEQVGGGGINVAHVVHSLGGRCQAMLPVGGSRGQDILQRLTDGGLDCITATIDQQNRQCFTVYETETGHEYRFVLPGPTFSQTEQAACISAICNHLPTDHLILSGSLPPGVPDDFYATVIEAVRHTHPTLRIVVDASGETLTHALAAGVFMIKPSREEFCELTGYQATEPIDCVAACRELISQGKAQVIALTLGADGALLVTADQAWQIDPLPVTVTSTVGAGDSFVGGFVWSLTQNPDFMRAARIATAAASAALQTQGELRFDAGAILNASQAVRVRPLPV
ncbi:MAG: 1-phosphofructokinase family hexose kinase [Burkholderiaceae bacterium]|nr:1-phosphofructokinase family hexose kinase [Burkholderiaceae bacterium]MCD8516258.1 1-phosphofructokinase family hexose kinase [Burkholderiaceae bacterium]